MFLIYPERPGYFWSLTNWIWQVDAISLLYRSRHGVTKTRVRVRVRVRVGVRVRVRVGVGVRVRVRDCYYKKKQGKYN